ncbi:circadian clock-controlled protein daywake-like [Ostrinia nubilalis]
MTLAGGLKIKFTNGHAKGLRKCIVEKARVMHDVIETQFLCNLTVKGKYKSSGRLLMFPINGDGDAAIRCKNLRVNLTLQLRSIKGSGDTYLEIVNSQSKHSYEGQIQYNLTNLIKGSPETSKTLLNFMNQNWHMVAQEFGDPLVDFGVKVILRNIKKLISAVPMNQLFTTWEPVPA